MIFEWLYGMKSLKYLITSALFFVLLSSYAQIDDREQGLFYKIGIATTLALNENYEVFNKDDDDLLLKIDALFIKNTLGYRFSTKTSIGLNLEANFHPEPFNRFYPAFLDFRYNIIDKDDNGFIRFGYGVLMHNSKLNRGTLYKIGLGGEYFLENSNKSILFGIDFIRKRFGYRQENKLSSVSLFLELIF